MIPLHLQVNQKHDDDGGEDDDNDDGDDEDDGDDDDDDNEEDDDDDDDDGGFVSWSVSLCPSQHFFSHVRMGLSGLNQY